ncbi:MAG: radical SAM protein [bacterium]|jgi:radical SAM superfamily enzyme YgiQ (UPF0313 family)|nr:radical SAM protein [bacterium]
MATGGSKSRTQLLAAEKELIPGIRQRNFGARLQVGLLYPNTYAVGMSSLGFQLLYRMFSSHLEIQCERFFLPDRWRPGTSGNGLTSLEEGRPLADFDVIAVCIAYELDLFNLARALTLSGIPPLSRERDESHPLIICGGPLALMNPEPIGALADVVCVSEAEPVLPPFIDELLTSPPQGTWKRHNLLRQLARLAGWYVPALYRPALDTDGKLIDLAPQDGVPARIKRVVQADLAGLNSASVLISPGSSFSDMCLVEAGRGCPHRCAFCFAAAGYHPLRFRRQEDVLEDMENALAATNRIGLVGISVGDIPWMDELCKTLSGRGIDISLSSLRPDRITEPLVKLLAEGGCRSLAVSVDAVSSRLRQSVRKKLSRTEILSGVEQLAPLKLENLKIYLMVGLPGETNEDLEEGNELLADIRQTARKAAVKRVTVSLNIFIPKPLTPFQREPMETVPVLKKKVRMLKSNLPGGVSLDFNSGFQDSLIQAAIARGDRRTGEAVGLAVLSGQERKGFRELSDRVHTPIEESAFLPWDIVI